MIDGRPLASQRVDRVYVPRVSGSGSTLLLVAQGDHRLDARGAPRRQGAGAQCDEGQLDGGSDHDSRVRVLHLEQERFGRAAQGARRY